MWGGPSSPQHLLSGGGSGLREGLGSICVEQDIKMLREDVCPQPGAQGLLRASARYVCERKGWWKNGHGLHPERSAGMVLWHSFPELVSRMGVGQGRAGSCVPTGRALSLWPTPSAIGQAAPSCPASPHPIPGESSHPFREAPFLQKQRQTQESGQGQGHHSLGAGSGLRSGSSRSPIHIPLEGPLDIGPTQSHFRLGRTPSIWGN